MTERKPRPRGPNSYINEADRLAILARMKEKGIRPGELATACSVTPSAITLLLKPIRPGKERGCKFLAKLQTALDLTPTAKRPAVVQSEQSRRAEQILKKLADDPEGAEQWLATGEWAASRVRKN